MTGADIKATETVFLKAKGYLHLDEIASRRNEPILSFGPGLLAALIAFFAKEVYLMMIEGFQLMQVADQ